MIGKRRCAQRSCGGRKLWMALPAWPRGQRQPSAQNLTARRQVLLHVASLCPLGPEQLQGLAPRSGLDCRLGQPGTPPPRCQLASQRSDSMSLRSRIQELASFFGASLPAPDLAVAPGVSLLGPLSTSGALFCHNGLSFTADHSSEAQPAAVLSHVDSQGRLGMVDVGHKTDSQVTGSTARVRDSLLTRADRCFRESAHGGGLGARGAGQGGFRESGAEQSGQGVIQRQTIRCPMAGAHLTWPASRATCWWWPSLRASRRQS